MPAEWAPHECCLIAWPTAGREYWGEFYLLAQATHAAVARAVARFEPVLVIANPGEGAIIAALYPENVDYLFFVAQGDGSHYFSKDFGAHEKAIGRYRANRKKAKRKVSEEEEEE